MPSTAVFSRRFAELLQEAEEVERTKFKGSGSFVEREFVDNEALIAWATKATNLLSRACGEKSAHYEAFTKNYAMKVSTNYGLFKRLRPVLRAAQDDYDGGYVVEMQSLIRAEVFDSELGQARELLDGGYKIPAAVVAGTVLETTLRQMCAKSGITEGKLDKMNADLVKVGAYNNLVQKRITALAGVRNSAAHGRPGDFTDDDVADMIEYVEKFVADHV